MRNRELLDDIDTSDDDVARYRRNLQNEIDSAAIYEAMADRETSPELAEVYRKLGAVEQRHARFWRGRLVEAGVWDVPMSPTTRARVLRFLARRMGPASWSRAAPPSPSVHPHLQSTNGPLNAGSSR